MESNEDENTSDFFKAFLYSLRATCFQFLEFKEHVSIRGFLAVDVDGQSQQHYVLSEIVSRNKAPKMTSFPLEVVTSSKSLDHGMTSSRDKSQKNAKSLPRDTPACDKTRHISRKKQSKTKLGQKTSKVKEEDCANISKTCKSPANIIINPPRPYITQSVRSDPSNSTFTMEQGKATPGRCRRKQASSGTGARKQKPSICISNTTVDVDPHLNTSHKIGAKPLKRGAKMNGSFSKRIRNITHSISRKDGVFTNRSVSTSRKRARESPSAMSPSTHCLSASLDSSSRSSGSCEDNAAYPQLSAGQRDENPNKNKSDPSEAVTEVSVEWPPYRRKTPGSNSYVETYQFEKFLTCCDSDQDCSITSVKPRYLVGHSMM